MFAASPHQQTSVGTQDPQHCLEFQITKCLRTLLLQGPGTGGRPNLTRYTGHFRGAETVLLRSQSVEDWAPKINPPPQMLTIGIKLQVGFKNDTLIFENLIPASFPRATTDCTFLQEVQAIGFFSFKATNHEIQACIQACEA